MAYEFIKANTEKIGYAAENVREEIAGIEVDIAKLEEAYSVLDAMWEGPAKIAFRAKYTDDINRMKELVKALKNINVFEETAENKYRNSESNVSEIISSITR